MRSYCFIIFALLLTGLVGCEDSPAVCRVGVDGCSGGTFSCEDADNCYNTERQCRNSGECG